MKISLFLSAISHSNAIQQAVKGLSPVIIVQFISAYLSYKIVECDSGLSLFSKMINPSKFNWFYIYDRIDKQL